MRSIDGNGAGKQCVLELCGTATGAFSDLYLAVLSEFEVVVSVCVLYFISFNVTIMFVVHNRQVDESDGETSAKHPGPREKAIKDGVFSFGDKYVSLQLHFIQKKNVFSSTSSLYSTPKKLVNPVFTQKYTTNILYTWYITVCLLSVNSIIRHL